MSLMELSGYARAMLLIPARGDQKCCPVLFSKWVGRRLEAESPEKLWCRLWSNGSQASARNVWYERWLWPLPHTDECHPKPLPLTRNPSRLQNSSAETVLLQKCGVPLEFASGSCSASNHVGSRYSVSQPCRLKPVWLKPLASGCLPGLKQAAWPNPPQTHTHIPFRVKCIVPDCRSQHVVMHRTSVLSRDLTHSGMCARIAENEKWWKTGFRDDPNFPKPNCWWISNFFDEFLSGSIKARKPATRSLPNLRHTSCLVHA